jgi:glycosyltransferase involved in cell wall biosynthesis
VRILQLVQTLDPATGGVARAVAALSQALVRLGHEVEIVALDDPRAPWLGKIGLPVHALGEGRGSYRYSKPLVRWLSAHGGNYDRVLVHGLWQHLAFTAFRRFARTSIPYYVFPHGMLDPWFKRTYPLKHLKKWLYWPWADYRVLRDAAAVIFTAEEEKLQARQSFWLYRAKEKISALGVDEPDTTPGAKEIFLARLPQLRGARLLLFLGRLHPKKGCDLLLEAFARHLPNESRLALVFAGPDQIGWEAALRERATQLDASMQVVFAGMLEGEVKQGAFEAADAFILPSHQENFGMAVAEALAVGLPVLISDRVNIWREIETDGAGYVEHDDVAGTTRLIGRWLATPDDERTRMRESARRCFLERFEINRAAASLLEVLNEPLARP